ncbi:sensor histidine kinase [Alteribacillus bidgolensis]|uniref:histidine kinase n=1 Tax=Alteribacillus bidgolensis TaxID=930129 RepID=A0A1G8RMW8_9BACI|nr:HAMP domain-containing sensor histidine kinase [Alteribacillus bidgolensis]SDJ18337.1 Signal transduction histidine kinase [Alteribacillus bidgolensis]
MNTIFYKLGGSIVILFLVVLLPLGFVMWEIFHNYNQAHLKEETEEMAAQYAAMFKTMDELDVELFTDSISAETVREIVVFDQTEEIIETSGIYGFKPNDTLPTQGETGTYTDPTNNQTYFYAGKTIFDVSSDMVSIYVFSPSGIMRNSAYQVQNALLLSGLGALLLAIGFTFIFSRKLTIPLQMMEKAARQLTRGDLEAKVPVTTRDEVGSLARTMNELGRELKRYRDSRSEFFSNVSHEFRTPLSYIQGYSHALKNSLYKNQEQKEQFIHIIHDEANRMNRLIDDLFELSRMEEERFPLELELVNLGYIARKAAEKVRSSIEEKAITLVTEIDEDIPNIVGDSFRLEQIVMNLLQNAIRYTEHGTVRVKVLAEDGKVIGMVSDMGPGIASEEIPYIFERFYRIEKSRARDFGGTGLGLAIVKQLTELQYGTIDVESRDGKGTTFTLCFPEAREVDE